MFTLLSEYTYHRTIMLTIKEKVYITVKEEEEQELGKIIHGEKIVGFDHNSTGWKHNLESSL